ncbi:hypothetical protein LINPERPRIM_LOCUS36474 [Linum perenne]
MQETGKRPRGFGRASVTRGRLSS